MIAAGVYKAKAAGAEHVEFGVSKTGAEQVSIAFEIVDERGTLTGERIRWFGSFKSPQSAEIAVRAMRAAGWASPDDVTDSRGIGSTVVELVVEEEEDQTGRSRTRVKWVNALGGGNGPAFKDALSPQQKRALAARLKSIALSAPPPPAPPNGAGPSFDDVPF